MHSSIALLPIKTIFSPYVFSPQIPHFSVKHPKCPTVFPIFSHFPPFFLGSFQQYTPTIALVPIKTMFFGLFSPKFPHFSNEDPKFPTVSPIFPESA